MWIYPTPWKAVRNAYRQSRVKNPETPPPSKTGHTQTPWQQEAIRGTPTPKAGPTYQTTPERPSDKPLDPSTTALQVGNGSREQAPKSNPKILELPKIFYAKTGWSSVLRLVESLYPWACGLLCVQSFLFEDKNDCFLFVGMICFILNSFIWLERINLIVFKECI